MAEMAFQQGVIAQQKKLEDGSVFPMVLLPCPSSNPSIPSFLTSIQNNIEWLSNQLDRVGAVLFRGFPVKNASDFNAVVEAFGWEEQPYLGAASRTRIQGRVYTANDCSLDQPIKSHHEMATFKEFPTKILFFCEIAPPEGGQTAIVLSHKITQQMEKKYPELIEKVEKNGLIYSTAFPAEDDHDGVLRGWQSHFQTKDKKEAEMNALKFGCKIQWLEDDSAMITSGPHVSIRTFGGQKKAWFNFIPFYSSKIPAMIGDGSVFPEEAIETCIQIIKEECVEVNWEAGDVLVLDNRFVQHAKRSSKPPRRVLAAFCK
eukprot:Gb_16281 [translate_table: standard]